MNAPQDDEITMDAVFDVLTDTTLEEMADALELFGAEAEGAAISEDL